MHEIKQYDISPISNYKILPNGFLRFVAPFFRTTDANEKGIKYFDKDSNPYYQRVSKELLDRTSNTFAGISITSEHPKEFIDSSNAATVTKGLTGTSQNSIFVTDKFSWITGTVFDEALINDIRNKVRSEISPGYLAALRSTDQQDVKDRIDQKGNHIAFVTSGRMGSTVSLNVDSTEWESTIDLAQFDSDYVDLIQSDLNTLPDRFLDLSINPDQEFVNLDQFTKKGIVTMKTANIVYDNQVFTIQCDQADQVATIFNDGQKLIKNLSEEKNNLVKQNDTLAAESKTEREKFEALQSELDAKKAENQTDKKETVKTEATAIALSMFKVLPKLLAVNPEYEINLDALDEIVLKRDFLLTVLPNQKDTFVSMNLDTSTIEGSRNIGKIEALFDLKSAELEQKQKDQSQNKPYSNLEELKILLTAKNGQEKQTDEKPDLMKDYIAAIDNNF